MESQTPPTTEAQGLQPVSALALQRHEVLLPNSPLAIQPHEVLLPNSSIAVRPVQSPPMIQQAPTSSKHSSCSQAMEFQLPTPNSASKSGGDSECNSWSQRSSLQARVDPNKRYCVRCPHRVEVKVVDIEDVVVGGAVESVDTVVKLKEIENTKITKKVEEIKDGVKSVEKVQKLKETDKRYSGLGLAMCGGVTYQFDSASASSYSGDEYKGYGMSSNEPEDSDGKQRAGHGGIERKNHASVEDVEDEDGGFFGIAAPSPASDTASSKGPEETEEEKTLLAGLDHLEKTKPIVSNNKGEKTDDDFILVSPLISPTVSSTSPTSMVFVNSSDSPVQPLTSPSKSDGSDVLFRPIRNTDSFSSSHHDEEAYDFTSRPTSFEVTGGLATINPMSPLLSDRYINPKSPSFSDRYSTPIAATLASFRTSMSSIKRQRIVSDADVSVMDMSFNSTRPNSFEMTPSGEYRASFGNLNPAAESNLTAELEDAIGQEELVDQNMAMPNDCQMFGCQGSWFSDDSSVGDDDDVVAAVDDDGSETALVKVRRVSARYSRLSGGDKLILPLIEEGARESVTNVETERLVENVNEAKTKADKVNKTLDVDAKPSDDADQETTVIWLAGRGIEDSESASGFDETKEATQAVEDSEEVTEIYNVEHGIISISDWWPDLERLKALEARNPLYAKITGSSTKKHELEATKPDDNNTSENIRSIESTEMHQNLKDTDNSEITVLMKTNGTPATATETVEVASRRFSFGLTDIQKAESAARYAADLNASDSDDDLGPLLAIDLNICRGCQVGVCPASHQEKFYPDVEVSSDEKVSPGEEA